MMRNRPAPGGGLLGDGPRSGAMPAKPAFQGSRGNSGLLGRAPPAVRAPQSNPQRGLLGTPPTSQPYQPQGRPARGAMGSPGAQRGGQRPQRPYVAPQVQRQVEDPAYYPETRVEEAYGEQEVMYEDPYVEQPQYVDDQAYLEEEYVEPYQEQAVEDYYEEDNRADLMEYAAGQVEDDYNNQQMTEDQQYIDEGYTEYDHEQPMHQARGPDRGLLEDPPMVDYEPYNRQDQQQFAGQRPRPQNQQQLQPARIPAHMEQRPPSHPQRGGRNDTDQRRQGLLESHNARPPRRGDGLLDPPDMRPLGGDQAGGRGLLDPPPIQPPVKPEALRLSRWSQDNVPQRPRSNERNQGRHNEPIQGRPNERNQVRHNEPIQGRPNERNQGRQNERGDRNMGRPVEREDPRQSDLMNMAELQMKMLEQEKARALEMEQAERLQLLQQQQAMILAQQQQLEQQQQQQFLQQQQEQQLLQQQQQAQSILAMGGQGGGNIPSIFDVSTGRNQSQLGKRQGADIRPGDNKRPRTVSAGRNDRNQSSAMRPRGAVGRQQSKDSPRDRKTRPSRFSSPTSRDRDRRDSGSQRGKGRSSARGRDEQRRSRERSSRDSKPKSDIRKSAERKNDSKEGVTREVTEPSKGKEAEKKTAAKEMKEEYDPANPTGDIPEELSAVKPAPVVAEKTEITIETEERPTQPGEPDSQEEKDVANDDTEISLRVTVNKKGRSVNDKEKQVEKKKMYKCNVCNIDCWDEDSFARHMNGQKHRQKMTVVMMTTSHQVDLVLSRKQAEEHLRQIEGNKRPNKPAEKNKAQESHCKTCDKQYTGAYTDHKEMPDHKAREDRAKAGCKICNVTSFSTFIDFTKHLESSWHRKNKRKQRDEGKDHDDLGDLVTLDTVGYEEDLNESIKTPESKKSDKKEESSVTSATVTVAAEKTESKVAPKESPAVRERSESSKEGELQLPGEYDPNVACGQTYVVPVIGFFCKLCHKFYNNENAAKVAHCQSRPHFDKYKKIMAAKIAKQKSKPATYDVKEDAKETLQAEDKPATEASSGEQKETGVPNGVTPAAGKMETQGQTESSKTAEEESGETSLDSTGRSLEEEPMEEDTPSEAANDTLTGDSTLGEENFEEKEEEEVAKAPVPRARRGGANPRSHRARRGRRGH